MEEGVKNKKTGTMERLRYRLFFNLLGRLGDLLDIADYNGLMIFLCTRPSIPRIALNVIQFYTSLSLFADSVLSKFKILIPYHPPTYLSKFARITIHPREISINKRRRLDRSDDTTRSGRN